MLFFKDPHLFLPLSVYMLNRYFIADDPGMVLNLEEDNVGAVLLGDSSSISEGDTGSFHGFI